MVTVDIWLLISISLILLLIGGTYGFHLAKSLVSH